MFIWGQEFSLRLTLFGRFAKGSKSLFIIYIALQKSTAFEAILQHLHGRNTPSFKECSALSKGFGSEILFLEYINNKICLLRSTACFKEERNTT